MLAWWSNCSTLLLTQLLLGSNFGTADGLICLHCRLVMSYVNRIKRRRKKHDVSDFWTFFRNMIYDIFDYIMKIYSWDQQFISFCYLSICQLLEIHGYIEVLLIEKLLNAFKISILLEELFLTLQNYVGCCRHSEKIVHKGNNRINIFVSQNILLQLKYNLLQERIRFQKKISCMLELRLQLINIDPTHFIFYCWKRERLFNNISGHWTMIHT